MSIQQALLGTPLLQMVAVAVTVAFIVTIAWHTAEVTRLGWPGAPVRSVAVMATVAGVGLGPFALVGVDAAMAVATRAALAVGGHDRLVPWPGVHDGYMVGVAAPAVLFAAVLASLGAVREATAGHRQRGTSDR